MHIDNCEIICKMLITIYQGGINMVNNETVSRCRVITTSVVIEGNRYLTYGIEYKNRRYEDLSVNRPSVEDLARRMEYCDVEPVHIDYVIEDFLVQ